MSHFTKFNGIVSSVKKKRYCIIYGDILNKNYYGISMFPCLSYNSSVTWHWSLNTTRLLCLHCYVAKHCYPALSWIEPEGNYYKIEWTYQFLSGRILSYTKNTVMILHCIHKITVTSPWKSLSNQLQRCCRPRGKYTFIILGGCIAVGKDLYD